MRSTDRQFVVSLAFATLLAAAAATVGAGPAMAQLGVPAAGADGGALGDRLALAVEALRTHRDTSGVAGLSAAIAVDGRLVWTGGFGWADLEHRVPMTAETVSRIGSISKPIAGTAAMVMVDRGLLDLDAPVSRYLPTYPTLHAERITTRQLMAHTAGSVTTAGTSSPAPCATTTSSPPWRCSGRIRCCSRPAPTTRTRPTGGRW